jgi:hypothetical protein
MGTEEHPQTIVSKEYGSETSWQWDQRNTCNQLYLKNMDQKRPKAMGSEVQHPQTIGSEVQHPQTIGSEVQHPQTIGSETF